MSCSLLPVLVFAIHLGIHSFVVTSLHISVCAPKVSGLSDFILLIPPNKENEIEPSPQKLQAKSGEFFGPLGKGGATGAHDWSEYRGPIGLLKKDLKSYG